MSTRRKRCEFCNELKDDVKKQTDPYLLELDGDQTLHLICESCAQKRADDV
jgi:hypothetical protein